MSAVADPNTGVAVYDTYGLGHSAGWLVFGGTSVASPIIASVYALAGGSNGTGASSLYANYSYGANLNDVKSGFNGSSCPAVTTTAVSSSVTQAVDAAAAATGPATAAAARANKGKPGPGGGGGGGSTGPNTYLCQAGAGYDGPTGRGTPNGIGAF